MTQTQTTAQTATDRIVSQIAETGEQTAREIAYAAEAAAEQIAEAKAKARALVAEELNGFKAVITGASEFAADLLDELAHDLHAFLGEIMPAQPAVSQPSESQSCTPEAMADMQARNDAADQAARASEDAFRASQQAQDATQPDESPEPQFCAACQTETVGTSDEFGRLVCPCCRPVAEMPMPDEDAYAPAEPVVTTAALPATSPAESAPIYPVALPVVPESSEPAPEVPGDGTEGEQATIPLPAELTSEQITRLGDELYDRYHGRASIECPESAPDTCRIGLASTQDPADVERFLAQWLASETAELAPSLPTFTQAKRMAKADLVELAVSRGLDREELSGYTKASIIAAIGIE